MAFSNHELLDQLKSQVKAVLAECEEGVKVNSFWNCFRIRHKYLPDPKTFGLLKRSELLDLFSDLFITTKDSKGEKVIKLSHKTLLENRGRETPKVAVDDRSGKLQAKGIAKAGNQKLTTTESKHEVKSKTEVTAKSTAEQPKSKPEAKLEVQKTTEGEVMSRKLPGNDFYSRFYGRQDAAPYQTSSHPHLTYPMQGQSVPVPYPTLGQMQYFQQALNPLQPLMAPQREIWNSSFQPVGVPPNSNANQSNSVFDAKEFPALGTTSCYTTSGTSAGASSAHSVATVPSAKKMNFTREQMNTVAEDCIERLSESKEYVSLERIEKLLLQHYSAHSLAQLNLRNLEELKCVYEHIRCECRVNLYIQMFVKTRAICSVHELSQCLKEFTQNRQDFETLHLGPLTKLPLVYKYFSAPCDKEICEIETADVLDYLRGYLSDNNLWTDNKASLQEFLKYMMEKRGLSTPFELGVIIKSLPLGIQILKKSQRDCGQAIRDAVSKLKTVVENDIDTAFHYFSSSIIHKELGVCQLRREYLSMSFVEVVNNFFAKLRQLYMVISEQEAAWELNGKFFGTGHARRKEVNKTMTLLNDLKNLFSKDLLLQRLIRIAICCSREEIYEQLRDIFQKKDDSSSDDSSDESEPGNLPNKDEVIASINKYMERVIAHGALTLDKLSKIEERLTEDFKLKHFNVLNLGSFLQFILKTEAVKKHIDESGGTLIGPTSHGVGAESCFHATVDDLLEFVSQCAIRDQGQHKLIEMAICHHYLVKEVRSLGHGCFANLVKLAEKQQRSSRNKSVFYASALIAKQFPSTLAPDRGTGPLGHKTKDQALACLQSCPLLEDLASWSHWDLVFKPELKELKDFVQKYGGVQIVTLTEGTSKKMMSTSILALEVRPGTLLKLTSDTSPEKFAEAAIAGNVSSTCGHLVSLIAINRGLENTPLALLGNHFKTALLQIQASQPTKIGPYQTKRQTDTSADIVQFVLDCIVKIPLVVGHQVINQVFLDGLSFLIGQTKSKEQLLSLAKTTDQLNHLQVLGILLGIREWADSFKERLNPPLDCIKDVDSQLTEIIDVDESSAEDVESSSDSVFSLSDDDDEEEGDDNEEKDEKKEPEVDESKATLPVARLNELRMKKSVEIRSLPSEPTTISLDDSDDEAMTDKTSDAMIVSDDQTADDGNIESEIVSLKEELNFDEVSEKEHSCQALIDLIRQEEFGFNVELNEDGTRLLTKQQERLGRSLERLSKDLYSKDTHFVLELIQNADDNEYPEHMLCTRLDLIPSVQFIVNHDSIIVYNNEVGFREINIRAICDVGRTTKGKHKFGYIGQKGIGFKSVFRVTDQPEIHSNGYHIRFDVNSKPLGYILPQWLPNDQRLIELPEEWTTCIALPMKQEMKEHHHSLSLAARFRDIHPSLLLFLHRLRSIEVINKVENYESKIRRIDVGEGITEIQHRDGIDKWLVVRKTLDASHISLQAKSGIEVESTEIALAFPMMSKEKIAAKVLPDRQPVFAFLPLRSYGFRFIVQGDFDVPSSREEVDRDSMWNQWLRNEIHLVFVNALEVFKSHSEFDVVEAVSYFLQFVPNQDEILDFFHPVATNILNQLKARPCLPSIGLQWKLPSQLLICSDALVREVVSSALLRRHLDLDYLHRDVAVSLNPPLLESLGVQSITTQHLIEVGKSIVANLNSAELEDVSDSIIKTSKWLLCICNSMDEFRGNDDILSCLRGLPMIPLTNGKIVSLESQTVFFPLSTLEKDATRQNLLTRLESDMHTVHPLLLGPPEDQSSLQIVKLLHELGVKKLTPFEVIRHHILLSLKSPDAENKPRDLLMAYVMYIKEHYSSLQSDLDMNEVKEAIILLTNHGPKRPHLEAVHFTAAYSKCVDLPHVLPGYPWVLVDSCYLQGLRVERQFDEWKEFLIRVGVVDFLAVRQRKRILKPSELADSHWSSYKNLLPPLDEYHVLDSECAEFEFLVTKNTSSNYLVQQMKHLFEQLGSRWDAFYKRHAVTQITNSHGGGNIEVDTSFGILLKSLEWIPVKFENKNQLSRSCDLFVDSVETQKLMANHVSYIIPTITSTSFAHYLDIQYGIDVEFVVKQLQKWSARTEPQNPTSFSTSLAHMRFVYEFLADNLPPRRVQELFNLPVIFVPDFKSKNEGCFLARQEVRWSDSTGLFDKYRDCLSLLEEGSRCFRLSINIFYHGLESIFVSIARVQFKPDTTDYVELLVQISLTTPLQKALRDVLVIFSAVGKELMALDEVSLNLQMEKVIALMKPAKSVPSKSGRWVGLENKTMIADDKQLEKLFKGNTELDFVDCGEKLGVGQTRANKDLENINLDFVVKFLTSLGIGRLSSCVDIKSQTEMYQPCPSLQKYVREVVPFIQRMVYCYPTIYNFLVNVKGIKNKLASMQFAQVAKLELIYSLKNLPDVPPVIFPQKCRLLNDQEMYVHRECVDSHVDINRELARYFSCVGIPCPDDVLQNSEACFSDLKSFLGDILPIIHSKSAALDELMEERNLLEFPTTEEEPWEVKEPVVIISHLNQAGLMRQTSKPPGTNADSESMEVEGMVENSGESSGLRSWPPQAPSTRTQPSTRSSVPQTSLMWPPPPPPQYLDHSNLPANLRPSNLEREISHERDDGNRQQEPGLEQQKERQEVPVAQRQSRGVVEKSNDAEVSKGNTDAQSGSGEQISRQVSSEERSHKRYDGDGPAGLPIKEPNAESSEILEQKSESSEGRASLPETAASEADHAAKDARPKIVEPMVIEFSMPSSETMARSGHKRARVNSGATCNDYVVPHAVKQLITSHFYGPPVWLAQTDETLFDDLGSAEQLLCPQSITLNEDSNTKAIGDWGELLVKDFLEKRKLQEGSDIIEIIHMNEADETGSPYDFILRHQSERSNITEVYIEVKTTMSSSKACFEISLSELLFANEKGQDYHLYRVFSAGNPKEVRLAKIGNLREKMLQNKVKLMMII